jgi:hypothetical protein
MKKIYPLILLAFLYGKGFSQNCVSLGCAAAHTGLATNGTLTPIPATNLGCYNPYNYTQIFWEFVYSPSGGDFTQTITPTSGTNLALNYVIFDEGTAAPSSVGCPVDASTWIQIACDLIDHPNQPSGPGLFGVTATTTAGHYYAIAIINWQSTTDGTGDASYTFDLSTPQIGGVDVDASNCPGTLPVSLSSFTATSANCVVNLNWVAQLQSNFKNYEVQTSPDGLHFQSLAIIAGKNQGVDQKFSYQDINAKPGDNFYRLKMTDADGKIAYSKIVSLNSTCNRTIVLTYPNPVRGILTVNIPNSPNGITVARLYSGSGKLVYSGTLQNGINSIDMSKYSGGLYLLNLKNSSESQDIKIVK